MATQEKNDGVYDPLDRSEFRRRVGDSFPSVYLTVISIIQGVALGILATNTYGHISSNNLGSSQILDIMPYASLTLLTVLIVSYEYAYFVGIFRWTPKFTDTAIPFILGVLEIGPMFFLQEPKTWWMLNAVLVLLGSFAYLNTYFNCSPDMFSNNKVYKISKLGSFNSFILAFLIGLVPLFMCLGYSYAEHRFPNLPIEACALVMYFAGMIALIIKNHRFLRKLHTQFELKF